MSDYETNRYRWWFIGFVQAGGMAVCLRLDPRTYVERAPLGVLLLLVASTIIPHLTSLASLLVTKASDFSVTLAAFEVDTLPSLSPPNVPCSTFSSCPEKDSYADEFFSNACSLGLHLFPLRLASFPLITGTKKLQL
ncbi:hypothetical protein EUGRSUZ_E02864 [Eucalyptus grandis]|uniref:Uncharacterized protein n=2 Tax=Eucalyptus grandis TaxID=71139 RepID=A0A059C7J9_EUCGR|nr:hypothetical protein EUGRSUZ_E02864 [Eucalyptus grandis]